MPLAPPTIRPPNVRPAARRRPSAAARGYGHKWRVASKAFLAAHRDCVVHLARGERVPATVVDHVVPHRGDRRLFWDRRNWRALCKACHDVKTAREDGGFGNVPR